MDLRHPGVLKFNNNKKLIFLKIGFYVKESRRPFRVYWISCEKIVT